MGDDGRIAGGQGVEEGLGKAHGHRVVGRLEQEVPRAMERWVGSAAQTGKQLRHDLDVRTKGELQTDVGLRKRSAQRINGGCDAWGGVFVEPRIDVRRAGGDRDAVRHRDAGHGQRRVQIAGAVVDAGEHVAVQVDQLTVS